MKNRVNGHNFTESSVLSEERFTFYLRIPLLREDQNCVIEARLGVGTFFAEKPPTLTFPLQSRLGLILKD